ncbi:MAG TPA: hypothetical protein VEL31_18820 [Ktedonobacteraceae bacterium]|nr:hypothetical protein [Ktedonobacteraceae bacterium]
MDEIEQITQEITLANKTYLGLLWRWQHGNHERILEQLAHLRALEQQLINHVGRQAAMSIMSECYQNELRRRTE